jgi:hypothetical protein
MTVKTDEREMPTAVPGKRGDIRRPLPPSRPNYVVKSPTPLPQRAVSPLSSDKGK